MQYTQEKTFVQKNLIYIIIASIAGVLLIALGLFFAFSGVNTHAAELTRDYNYTKGPADASVEVVYFFDFECPGCRSNDSVIKEIGSEYSDRIKFTYRNFPLDIHPSAPIAHRAAQAVVKIDSSKYEEFKTAVFARQTEINSDTVREITESLDIDIDRFNELRNSREVAAEVALDIKDGRNLRLPEDEAGRTQISATPTTIIYKDGEIQEHFTGTLNVEEYRLKLDGYLE